MTTRVSAALLFVALGVAVVALVLCFETSPQTGATMLWGIRFDAKLSETLLLVVCAAVALGLLGGIVTRRRPPVAALALAAMLAGLLYLYGQRGAARGHYAKWHDTFHYVLGAKYFDELGYYELYDCVAVAHVSTKPRLARVPWKVRDLRTYKMISATEAMSRTPCRARFSRERWQQFERDVALFDRYKSIPSLLRDHGYNGSPTHTFFASRLANLFELSYGSVTKLALLDVAAISAMMAVVCLAFGARLGFLFAILFFVNFSDRFYFIGGSMMRYVWMATLTGGIAMLKLGRYRAAGALMTTAALLNIFPVLFLVGLGVRVIWTTARTKQLARHYRRFIAAAAITAAIGLGLGASHADGPSNYSEFLGFIGGHSQKLTSSRTGLRFTVLYRGQTNHTEKATGYRTKARELLSAVPFLVALGGLMLAIGVVLCARLDDVEASTLLGMLLFFVVFGTVEYYYAVTPLLLLVFHRRWRASRTAAWLVAALFGGMAVVLLIWRQTHFLKFCNNTVMSAALLSMLAATLVYLAAEETLLRRLGGRAYAGLMAAAAISGPAVVMVAYWLYT